MQRLELIDPYSEKVPPRCQQDTVVDSSPPLQVSVLKRVTPKRRWSGKHWNSVQVAKKSFNWKVHSRTSNEEPPENSSSGVSWTVLSLGASAILCSTSASGSLGGRDASYLTCSPIVMRASDIVFWIAVRRMISAWWSKAVLIRTFAASKTSENKKECDINLHESVESSPELLPHRSHLLYCGEE